MILLSLFFVSLPEPELSPAAREPLAEAGPIALEKTLTWPVELQPMVLAAAAVVLSAFCASTDSPGPLVAMLPQPAA